ncbi:MAG: hypothetical protein V4471_05175 [Pseudomonadota bacterium]
MKKSETFIEILREKIQNLKNSGKDPDYLSLCKEYTTIIKILSSKIENDATDKIAASLRRIDFIVEAKTKKHQEKHASKLREQYKEISNFFIKSIKSKEIEESSYFFLANNILEQELAQKLNVKLKEQYSNSNVSLADRNLVEESVSKLKFMCKLKLFIVMFQDEKKDKAFTNLKAKVIMASKELEQLAEAARQLSSGKNFASSLNNSLQEIYSIALQNKDRNPDPYAYIVNLFLAYGQEKNNSAEISDIRLIDSPKLIQIVQKHILEAAGIDSVPKVTPYNSSNATYFRFTRVSTFLDLKPEEANEVASIAQSVFQP